MDISNSFSTLSAWFLSHGLKVLAILIVCWLLSRGTNIFIKKLIKALIKKSDKLRGAKAKETFDKRGKTLSRIFRSFSKTLIWTIAVLTILPEFYINIGPLLAGAGIIGLAIGMGARSIIQDYLAGIFIVFENQYLVGEKVKIAGITGKVLDINLRRTLLKDDNKEVYFIPNGQIKVVSNLSREINE